MFVCQNVVCFVLKLKGFTAQKLIDRRLTGCFTIQVVKNHFIFTLIMLPCGNASD